MRTADAFTHGTHAAVPLRRERWVHVASHLHPKYGGISTAVPALACALNEAGSVHVQVDAFCHDDERVVSATLPEEDVRFWPANRRTWMTRREWKQAFAQHLADASGVHIHGLWEGSCVVAASFAQAHGKPYVLSAHGMLEPWALAQGRLKKAVYTALVQRRILQRAACLHALTHAEADHYRRYGARNPVAIIPNGVHVPEGADAAQFLEAYPSLRGRRIVLFLARLHPKKGADLLLDAWAQLAPAWPDADLVLAGPDFEGMQASLQQQAVTRGIAHRTVFPGMLQGAMKWSALAAAECFVLPSHSEGLSMGLLEAMGMGVPVIATEQCNLPEIATHDTGLVIRLEVAQLAQALDDCLRDSAAAFAKGQRGRGLIAEKYTWARVALSMNEVYEWVRGGPTPASCEVMA